MKKRFVLHKLYGSGGTVGPPSGLSELKGVALAVVHLSAPHFKGKLLEWSDTPTGLLGRISTDTGDLPLFEIRPV